MLDDSLLGILACPIDKGPLLYLHDDAMLYNPRLRRAYKIEDGVPVLLASQGMPVTDNQHERILNRASQSEATSTGGRSQ